MKFPVFYVASRSSPSFNKEIFVDFITAQIKTLSFLAYIVRVYQVRLVSSSFIFLIQILFDVVERLTALLQV